MKEFYKKIKLVINVTTELNIPKKDFIEIFRRHVDQEKTGFMSNTFDVFSSSKNEYKGIVGQNDFKIKRRKRFFDTNRSFATARGTYRQKGNTLFINTEISGVSRQLIFILAFIIFFYAMFFVSIFFADEPGKMAFMIPLSLFQGAIMLCIPYFILRRGVRKMAHDLEREFYYMTKGHG